MAELGVKEGDFLVVMAMKKTVAPAAQPPPPPQPAENFTTPPQPGKTGPPAPAPTGAAPGNPSGGSIFNSGSSNLVVGAELQAVRALFAFPGLTRVDDRQHRVHGFPKGSSRSCATRSFQ
jgi:hypothetical protein